MPSRLSAAYRSRYTVVYACENVRKEKEEAGAGPRAGTPRRATYLFIPRPVAPDALTSIGTTSTGRTKQNSPFPYLCPQRQPMRCIVVTAQGLTGLILDTFF